MFRARKRFGQHFLTRQDIISRIIQHLNPQPGQHIVEIGPGTGALTGPLIASGASVTVVEIDRDLAGHISAAHPQVRLIVEDVLKVDLSQLFRPEAPARVLGNLPYNISTPLLFRLLESSEGIEDMLFMLQLEVANRLTASPGAADYGRLSIMAACYTNAQKLFEVPPDAFDPPPKVTSAMIELLPRPAPDPAETALLSKLVTQAFNMRRKTIRNSLKPCLSADELLQLGLDPGARPENLDLDAFLACARYLLERQP